MKIDGFNLYKQTCVGVKTVLKPTAISGILENTITYLKPTQNIPFTFIRHGKILYVY